MFRIRFVRVAPSKASRLMVKQNLIKIERKT